MFSLESISGGGWSAHSDNSLDPFSGASLLEGARGGDSCFASKETGIHGQGGFGGGGGGCRTGGTIVSYNFVVALISTERGRKTALVLHFN